MAYLTSAPKDEEQTEQDGQITKSQGANIQAGGPTQTSGSPGTKGGGSGTFTNIQDYVEANKPKTQQLAKDISGRVTQSAQKVRSNVEQQKQQNLGETGRFGTQKQQFLNQQIQKAGKDPLAEQDVAEYRKYATGQYKAPDLGEQRRTAQDLERRAREYGTSKGRFEALQGLVGKQSPTYSKGQKRLDQLLLAGDRASNQQALRQMQKATQGLGENVQNVDQSIQQARQALQQQATQGIEQGRTGTQEAIQSRYQDLSNAIKSGQFTDEQLAQMGLERGQQHFGADLQQGLDLSQGVTQQDLSRLDALAKLAGQGGRSQYLGQQDIASGVGSVIESARKGYETELEREQRKVDELRAIESAMARAAHSAGNYRDSGYVLSGNEQNMRGLNRIADELNFGDGMYGNYNQANWGDYLNTRARADQQQAALQALRDRYAGMTI